MLPVYSWPTSSRARIQTQTFSNSKALPFLTAILYGLKIHHLLFISTYWYFYFPVCRKVFTFTCVIVWGNSIHWQNAFFYMLWYSTMRSSFCSFFSLALHFSSFLAVRWVYMAQSGQWNVNGSDVATSWHGLQISYNFSPLSICWPITCRDSNGELCGSGRRQNDCKEQRMWLVQEISLYCVKPLIFGGCLFQQLASLSLINTQAFHRTITQVHQNAFPQHSQRGFMGLSRWSRRLQTWNSEVKSQCLKKMHLEQLC